MNREEQIKFILDNYPATTHHISNRRIRHTFFLNIRTELQAYLLGFYAADGSIDEKRKTFRVELQNRDKEIVYLFKDTISTDARIYSNPPKDFMGPRGKMIHTEGSIGVDITSAELCNSLLNYGIGYRKSYNDFEIPNIPLELIRHFFRGFFDGDGSFSGYVYLDKNRPNPRVRMTVSIDSKRIVILLSIQKFLALNDINLNIIYLKRDDMYRLSTSSKVVCKKLYKFIYEDSYFYLNRKFEKFSHYVNTEESQLIAEFRNALLVNVNESNNPTTSLEHPSKDDDIC